MKNCTEIDNKQEKNSKKLIIFHPTIAPYRIDFFNDLYQAFDTKIYLYYENLRNQTFNYEHIKNQFCFTPYYMKKQFGIGERCFYKGHIKEILRQKPDIVVTGEYSIGTWCAIIARILSRKKFSIVSICDDSEKMAQDCSTGRKISRELLLKRLNGLILCNDAAQKWYNKHSLIASCVFPIIHCDDIYRKQLKEGEKKANQLLTEYALAGKKVFIYVGRLSEEKNVPYLIKSFVKAHEANSDIVLFIVGDSGNAGTMVMDECHNIVKETQAGSYVHFVGRKENEELAAFYLIGQVLVLPSKREAFGAVVNEALLAGEYVMVSSNAGASGLVTEGNGEVINIKNTLIDFTSMIERLQPLDKQIQFRDSLMPYTYEKKMKELTEWLNEI